jgi:hypothetical protein
LKSEEILQQNIILLLFFHRSLDSFIYFVFFHPPLEYENFPLFPKDFLRLFSHSTSHDDTNENAVEMERKSFVPAWKLTTANLAIFSLSACLPTTNDPLITRKKSLSDVAHKKFIANIVA